MTSSPVTSPAAPAGGWKVARSIPVTSQRISSAARSTSSAPCAIAAGVAGGGRGTRGARPPSRTPSGCTSSCKTPTGRPRDRRRSCAAPAWSRASPDRAPTLRAGSAVSPPFLGGRGLQKGHPGRAATSRRPADERSCNVGSASPPASGAEEARPAPTSATGDHLLHGIDVRIELSPGASLGDCDEQAVFQFGVVDTERYTGEEARSAMAATASSASVGRVKANSCTNPPRWTSRTPGSSSSRPAR